MAKLGYLSCTDKQCTYLICSQHLLPLSYPGPSNTIVMKSGIDVDELCPWLEMLTPAEIKVN